MDEKKLASRLARGDTEALGNIIEKYTGYVCTAAFNFSRGSLSPEDIDDIAEEVFIKLWSCRKNIKAEIGLRSYLSASARNAVKDRFKKRLPETEDISELDAASDFLVEDAAELNEMISCLYEGLKKLPNDDREIFFRFYFNGETAARIAEKNGVTKGAVDAKLHRARKKLKSYLNERGFYNV